ncbi:MAG TPA: hypothetical protein VHD91_10530 [Gaiellaceae bacterium]|nr:hypothetical protein [Gaiellaceae bacterium]
MFKRLAALFVPVAAAFALAPAALASGGHYVFDGGTSFERSQVTQALNASTFPWDIVPGTIVVHIGAFPISDADPGELWLDSSLLDSGEFSWGVVQHEYGHQVDFSLLTAADRTQLAALLGGSSWWNDGVGAHGDFTCERFASTLAWAYWPSRENVMEPQSSHDEAGHVSPAAFRAALAALVPQAIPTARVLQADKAPAQASPKRGTSAARKRATH